MKKTIALVVVSFLWCITWIGLYISRLHQLPISNNPDDWALFSTFFSGIVLAPLTFIASIFAAYHVYKNLQIDTKNQKYQIDLTEVNLYQDKLNRLSSAFDESLKRGIKRNTPSDDTEINSLEEIIQMLATDKKKGTSLTISDENLKYLPQSLLGNLNTICQCVHMYAVVMNKKILKTEDEREGQVTTEIMIWCLKYNQLSNNLRILCTEDELSKNPYFNMMFCSPADFIDSVLSS